MNSQRPEPPHQRRPSAGPPPEAPTRRVEPPAPDPRRGPPLAWSQEPPPGRPPRFRQQPFPPPPPRPSGGATPSDPRRNPARGAAGHDYAPRQRPEPIPAGASDRRSERTSGTRSRGTTPPPRRPGSSRRAPTPPPPPPRRKKRRRVPIVRILLVLALLLVLAPVGMTLYFDTKLHRVDALAGYPDRIGDTPGTNWLIVGTDSREGLTADQKKVLATGDADGARTDTIMMAHIPLSGPPMLISIPRDLYVPIPGVGSHKINAAFNNGGASLLVQTVEEFTGVRIDHYAEIGFGGFDNLVDAVGGVTMCLDMPLRDPKAGLRLKAGCQRLNGAQALGLVRTRAFPNADLERVVNQRKFLAALMSRATSPSVLLNPFRLFPFVSGAVDSVTVDRGDHLWHLAWLAFKIKGDPVTTTVPTDGDAYTDDGDALMPGETTRQFFDHVARGQSVPENLLSSGGGAVS